MPTRTNHLSCFATPAGGPRRSRRARRVAATACVAACSLLSRVAAGADAAGGTDVAAGMGLQDDPVLSRLLDQSLAMRPEVRRAQALVAAERERVPQAGALPDPVLGLAIQNDSFNRIQIGEAETSFYQVLISQGVPFPGKRGLRTDIADLGAQQAESTVARVRLSTEAEVRRMYLDLLVARDRLALLDRLEAIWQQAAGIAETRYGTGEGSQADILRSQLEVARIRQRRALLRAEERTRVQALDRLRGWPPDEPVVTRASVRDVVPTRLPGLEALVDDALARSPELAQARLGVTRAHKRLELSERDRFPDFGVNVGVMPRGSLEPMWTVGLSVGLPVWIERKQNRAVAEDAARAEADGDAAMELEHRLRLRAAERHAALEALLETVRLYREGLLVRSRATVESTISQYRVGRAPFVAVLEANVGYVGDEEGYVLALADAQRIAIATREVSLAPVALPAGAGGGMGAARGDTGGGMEAASGATEAGGVGAAMGGGEERPAAAPARGGAGGGM